MFFPKQKKKNYKMSYLQNIESQVSKAIKMLYMWIYLRLATYLSQFTLSYKICLIFLVLYKAHYLLHVADSMSCILKSG